MKGQLGYGRYDDDPKQIGCPRAKSDMTPCAARDGKCACTDAGTCVGCGMHAADLLKEAAEVLSRTPPDPAPIEWCDICPHNMALHNPDGSCGCGIDCAAERAKRG